MTYKLKTKLKYLIFLIDFIGYILFSPIFLYNKFKKIKKPKTILIIKNDFIGDMLLTTPFFENLKHNYPKTTITLACRSSSTQGLKNNPNINKIIKLNTPWISRNDSMGWKQLFKFIKFNFRKYDLVFELHTEPRNILLSKFVGKNVIGYGHRGLGFLLTKKGKTNINKHIVEQNLDLLKTLNLTIKNKNTKLFLSEPEMKKAKDILKKINLNKNKKTRGIHPGTSDSIRQWPATKFNKLIKKLQRKYNILVFETDKNNARIVCQNTKAINLSNKLSLREFFAIVKELDLLIGLESLSGHVAAAVDTKSLIIFSSTTDPNVMSPYSNKTKLIYKKIKCSCCNKYICPNNDGIKLIDVEQVYQKIEEQLK